MSTTLQAQRPAALPMKQAIAGVAPTSLGETTVMTVWPSNGAYVLGRFLGTLYASKAGFSIFTLGNLFALLSIPLALKIFFWRLLPFVGTRYQITSKRIRVLRGIKGVEEKAVDLDRFDAIDIVVQAGQAWYDSGDLVFRKGTVEVFRLDGVSRPQAFRQTCLKAHMGFVGAKNALEREAGR